MTTSAETQHQVRANTRAAAKAKERLHKSLGLLYAGCWVPESRKAEVEQFAKEAEDAVKKHEGEKW